MVYYYTKMAIYHFLVFTIGFPLMLLYALLIAICAFTIAWILSPILQSSLMFLGPIIKMPMRIVVVFFSPVTVHLVKAIRKICPQRWYQ